MSNGWLQAMEKNDLDAEQMFALFSVPFLEETIARGGPIRFAQDPWAADSVESFFHREFEHLRARGLMFDVSTGEMVRVR